MLTCKKLGQRAVFDTDKLFSVVFHAKIIFDNFIYFKQHIQFVSAHYVYM